MSSAKSNPPGLYPHEPLVHTGEISTLLEFLKKPAFRAAEMWILISLDPIPPYIYVVLFWRCSFLFSSFQLKTGDEKMWAIQVPLWRAARRNSVRWVLSRADCRVVGGLACFSFFKRFKSSPQNSILKFWRFWPFSSLTNRCWYKSKWFVQVPFLPWRWHDRRKVRRILIYIADCTAPHSSVYQADLGFPFWMKSISMVI